MKRRIAAVLAAVLMMTVLGGCSDSDTEITSADADSGTEGSSGSTAETDSDMFTDRDFKTSYDEDSSVHIQLNGDSAAADSDSVQISGTTITITEEAVYVISGTLDDGMIIVNTPDTAKLQLVFDGANINSASSAALYILEADKVFVTLEEGTENVLSNGGTFTAIDDSNIDGALFSRQDLTINGSGSLTVTSPAGHGIVCKDDLVFTGGTCTVTSASHGLDVNDSIRITGETTLVIDAGKDGMHAENDEDSSLGFVYISGGNIEIEAEGDGISSGAYMQILDGVFQITAGGGSENGSSESSDSWGRFQGGGGPGRTDQRGDSADMERPGGGDPAGQTALSDISEQAASDEMEQGDASADSSTSMKGLKAAGSLAISGGNFTIDSADDSIHSNMSVTVSGGTFEIASGDDAVHAEETLSVMAGVIHISECYEGLEALHVEIQDGEITLTAQDDGLNAAGGTDSSGMTGGRDGMFGGEGGGGMSSSSDGTIVISGGTLYINASGDGIDANGSIEMSGGSVTVTGPSQGDTSTLDYDTTAVITGGTFIGTGASGMAQSFSSSEQGVIAVNAGTQDAGTAVVISDAEGNTLLSYEPELAFNVIIFSSPDVVSGETYTISAGSASGDVQAQ